MHYTGAMPWDVYFTEQPTAWFRSLSDRDQDRFLAVTDLLARKGPALGRPTVDSIKGSRHHNMKELRVGTMRALFIFDPESNALILFAGDKRNRWTEFYESAIPAADDRYDRFLAEPD